MPVLVLSALSRPSGRSFVLLLLLIVAVPAILSYLSLGRAAASYNVCFVGPTPSFDERGRSSPAADGGDGGWDDEDEDGLGMTPDRGGGGGGGESELSPAASVRLQRRLSVLADLYGTYRTFDGASYYYVKTPFDVTPSCAFQERKACGWPSASSLARVLSPRGVRRAKEAWRRRAKSFLEGRTGSFRRGGHGGGPGTLSDRKYDEDNVPINKGGKVSLGRGGVIMHTADAVSTTIGWDRGGPHPTVRGLNRWCLSSTYLPDGPSDPPVKVKICTPEVPSIVVHDPATLNAAISAAAGGVPNLNDEPFAPVPEGGDDGTVGFPELPLSPPPNGVWSVEEASEVQGMGYGAFHPVRGDADGMEALLDEANMGGGGGSGVVPRGMKVRVHCHQNKRQIGMAAGGSVRMGPWDEQKGDMPPRAEWNLLRLPGTAILMGLCLYVRHKSTKLIRILAAGGSTRSEAWESLLRARAVSYNRVAVHPPSELWRAYAASFHHASLPHLALVLWNLYWIGATLEEDYGTLPYLYLSVSAVALVTLLTLALVRLQMALKIGVEPGTDPVRLRTRAVLVGYLPVLLAWGVVASAERPSLRPIPDVDVPTLVFFSGYFKFNALVAFNLVLAACVAPKSSMVSHLAGGLAGLMLHFGAPPFSAFVPQVVIPVALLLHWTYVRRGCGRQRSRHGGYDRVDTADSVMEEVLADDGDSAAGGVPSSPTALIRHLSREYATRARDYDSPNKHHLDFSDGGGGGGPVVADLRPMGSGETVALFLLRILNTAVAVYSLASFDHGAAAGQLAASILFHISVTQRYDSVGDAMGDSTTNSFSASRSRTDADAALRYHFLSAATLLLSDAATGGAWFVTKVFVQSDPTVLLDIEWAYAALGARMAVNLAGMILNAAALRRGDEWTDLCGPYFRLAEEAGEGILHLRVLACGCCGGDDKDDEDVMGRGHGGMM